MIYSSSDGLGWYAGDSEGDQYVFRLEEDTYVYSKGVQAYMTVVDKKPDSLRGHGNSPRKVSRVIRSRLLMSRGQ